ncbi:MAG: LytTR family DNA-binding domain-containing protein [Pseudoxanthomonas sp.]
MKPLRVLIADDEPMARLRLERLIGHMAGAEVVAVCSNARAATDAIGAHAPDVAFLDIRMPDATGFDVLSAVRAHDTLFVFVTAHAEYATTAFDEYAVDYLVKPYTAERLATAMERVRQRLEGVASLEKADGGSREYLSRVSATVGRRVRIIAVDQIDHARAQANYVEVHVDGREYLIRSTIGDLALRLDPSEFMRVHRSSLIRIAAVESLESDGSARYKLHMRGGYMVLSGRSYREAVRSAFGLA